MKVTVGSRDGGDSKKEDVEEQIRDYEGGKQDVAVGNQLKVDDQLKILGAFMKAQLAKEAAVEGTTFEQKRLEFNDAITKCNSENELSEYFRDRLSRIPQQPQPIQNQVQGGVAIGEALMSFWNRSGLRDALTPALPHVIMKLLDKPQKTKMSELDQLAFQVGKAKVDDLRKEAKGVDKYSQISDVALKTLVGASAKSYGSALGKRKLSERFKEDIE